MIFCCATTFAQTSWTVQSVPNTRLESNDIHVSDPDGYLSDSAEININTALCAIRDKADVFVVTLSSIGDDEPKRFATQLFNYWGIGDAATDNGVLLLFVEDQHALEFETGYGAEETMTDAKCQQIFTQTIVPYFKAGDYEGGLCAGVADIVGVYGGTIPAGLKTTLPSSHQGGDVGSDDEEFLVGFLGMFLLGMPVVGTVYWWRKRKQKSLVSERYKKSEEGGVTYVDGLTTTWSGSPWEGKGCLGGLTLGFSCFVFFIIASILIDAKYPDMEPKTRYIWLTIATLGLYFTWICFRQNQRALAMAEKLSRQSVNPKAVYKAAFDHGANKIAMWMAPWMGWVYYLIFKKKMEHSEDCCCPHCSGMMRKYDRFKLPENHVAEKNVGAFKFTPYHCGNGHVVVVKEHGARFSAFSTCPQCKAYTLKKNDSKTIKAPDYTHYGEKMETFVCEHCGHTFSKTVVVPMLVRYSSSSSSHSSSSSRSYSSRSSSSRSSGGYHGGGRSGGGGYSGRW